MGKGYKKDIFGGVLTGFQPYVFNEIVLCTMKSSLCSDKIFSLPKPYGVGFYYEVILSNASRISSAKDGFN